MSNSYSDIKELIEKAQKKNLPWVSDVDEYKLGLKRVLNNSEIVLEHLGNDLNNIHNLLTKKF